MSVVWILETQISAASCGIFLQKTKKIAKINCHQRNLIKSQVNFNFIKTAKWI